MMASSEAASRSREVAAHSPEKILRESIDPPSAAGISRRASSPSASASGRVGEQGRGVHAGCTSAFVDSDASMAEINPLVLTKQGDLIALDAKMGFDDNALFRHPRSASCAT
jgi:succinyl-CoA synthetase beta subunit